MWGKYDFNKIDAYSNTTLVKVKLTTCKYIITTSTNSNTTLVKVKFVRNPFQHIPTVGIQIQHLLKLNR